MRQITHEEMREIFGMLEKAGMNPRLCDKAVPYYDVCVQAGLPTDPGYITPGEMVWLSNDLARPGMVILNVRGESMRDAGILPGDRIVVEYGTAIRDGDIVVAMIDGESTLKTFMTDDSRNRWLVPHNPDFQPILLTEDMGTCTMGKVVQLIKDTPRVGYSEIMKIIDGARKSRTEQQPPTKQEVVEAIRCVAPYVTNSRMWFAVYRVLLDRKVLRENAFDTFVQWLEEDVPAHPYMPKAVDLQRLAVQSFSKPVKLWNADNAPVSGKRFRDYCDIARRMEEAL